MTLPRLWFAKVQALGNDFVWVLDPVDAAAASGIGQHAPLICNRHFGVGADGMVLWDGAENGAEVWFLNADGTQAEVCGNGLRAVAAAGRDLGLFAAGRVDFRSAGVCFSVIVRAPDSPLAASLGIPRHEANPGVDRVLKAWSSEGSLVFMPNPHIVVFHSPQAPEQREKLAGELACQVVGGANVGFCTAEEGLLHLQVWERGVGWTLACGSGAAGAAAVALRMGFVSEGVVPVRQPGGMLRVWFDDSGCAWIEGIASLVFVGTVGGESWVDVGSPRDLPRTSGAQYLGFDAGFRSLH